MPAMTLRVSWPDGKETSYYSPSSIITQYFEDGQVISVNDFREISVKAFDHASQRVEQVLGFACTSAMASKHSILDTTEKYIDDNGSVEIISVTS